LTIDFSGNKNYLVAPFEFPNRKTTPRLTDSGTHRLLDLVSRGVADSLTRQVGESAFECLKENSAKTPENPPRCHVPLMLLVGGEGFMQL
jgi:hypothetical protein